MKRSVVFLLSINILLLSIVSCRKESAINGEERKQLLTGKKWQIVASSSIDSAGKETDLFTGLPDFVKDDYLMFNADSTYVINANLVLEGDSVSRIIDAGSWVLIRDARYIEQYSAVYNIQYQASEIVELSPNKLLLLILSPSDRSSIRTQYQRIN